MQSYSLENEVLIQRSLLRQIKMVDSDLQIAECVPLSEENLKCVTDAKSCIDVLKCYCDLYAQRPAIGFRIYENYETITYQELWNKVEIAATGLKNSGFVNSGDLVGICAFGSLDFVILDFACLYLGAISVPLQTGMHAEDLNQIINNAGITSLVTSEIQLENTLNALIGETSVKNLGIIDIHSLKYNSDLNSQLASFEEHSHCSNINFWNMEYIENIGKHSIKVSSENPDPEALATLVYTSGSTGLPKGAMIPHRVWIQFWKESGFAQFHYLPLISVNFMPLNHIMGRNIVISCLQRGGSTYFTKSETMSTLFEDMRLVRPTLLFLVPRISEMIYQEYQLKILQNGTSSEQVLNEMRTQFLGDRLLAAVTAAAPTSPELFAFLKNCFQIPVFNCYGSTEAGVLTFENTISTATVKDYKIVSVPELGYFTTDKPYPRGELRVKSLRAVQGYYKNLSATKDLFDEEGYLRMGDIVEEQAQGKVVCIDRIKNIQKLANGEYVTLARLESIFSNDSSFMTQVYMYGNSTRSFLLCVVVANMEAILTELSKSKTTVNDHEIKKLIRHDIQKIAKNANLFPHEIPRDFIIESEPFTKNNKLLTESNKFARSNLKKKYAEKLENLYLEIDKNQLNDLIKLNELNASILSPIEKIKSSLAAILNINSVDFFENDYKYFSFKEIGGDSLNAVTLSSVIENICHVKIPASFILNPSVTIQKLLLSIETKMTSSNENQKNSFENIHGTNSEMLLASDLQIEKFFSQSEISEALKLKKNRNFSNFQNVLLTGANGFLGKFLTLELLEKVFKSKGKLFCIVRAENNEKAYLRMLELIEKCANEIQERFYFLARNTLVVLAGDLSLPKFGLSNETYETMCQEVDVVLHNGALVNHAFSYSELYEPNLLGTVEIIRFAISKRLKAITFISSIAVVSGLVRENPVNELEDIRQMWPARRNGNGYAEGYAISKWAGEVLLRNASEMFTLPVNVFRSGMILAHRFYESEINISDFFTRLLCGVINTGIAPESFYQHSQNYLVKPYFDGLPVDFIANVVTEATMNIHDGFYTYHIVNPQGNFGISFDLIVNWIISAGYNIQKIDLYSDWFAKFEIALKKLTGIQKQYSPLQIIHQWEKPVSMNNETQLDNTQFALLAAKSSKPDYLGVLPIISEEYIRKYLADLDLLGLINKQPAQKPSEQEKIMLQNISNNSLQSILENSPGMLERS